ncbi:uncharacterized protein LOC109859869 [Pseudomyrmex gracilis]|uniref:uncharacterized protein LOC109859869 n=1 Tax=Pseudomyrmex gracilis TaxID=219809 RepID=UPI000995C2DC|nr:uncharacterized protein LOC109859869 [Pseudomyrmex gracilis]XP_020294120.1 uncharacterized protein LOC109859869 [Pseudomyrmex gracilis]XP_020294121.1 uncharacterized protein LOC109859869 [Pseudomyrmex gracilis]
MNPDEPLTSSESKPRKRTHSNIELEVESEQTKQQEHDVPIQGKKAKDHQATNILDCPDILLFRIFQHVDKEDLRNLSLCCTKFSRIALHKFFWTCDCDNEPILPFQMDPYETFLEPLTHTLDIRGDYERGRENILGHLFFFQVKQICQILHTLKLQNYFINLDEVTPEMSTTIEYLFIINCIACSIIRIEFYTTYFFRGICRFVPHLKHLYFYVVIWDIESLTFLTSISNLTDLVELKVESCFRIQEFDSDIDLVTVTCKCHNLKILDFTNTLIEHKLVEWFCQIESLEEVYLQCPIYLRENCSNESLEELQNFEFEEYIPLRFLDEKLYTFLCTVESLLDQNEFEEIIIYRNNQFPNYLLSNISRCISRCTNLKKLHIRHYSHVTRTDINKLALTLPNLVELDITGCSVTLEDVKHFKSQRPNVKTYSAFSTRHEKYEMVLEDSFGRLVNVSY